MKYDFNTLLTHIQSKYPDIELNTSYLLNPYIQQEIRVYESEFDIHKIFYYVCLVISARYTQEYRQEIEHLIKNLYINGYLGDIKDTSSESLRCLVDVNEQYKEFINCVLKCRCEEDLNIYVRECEKIIEEFEITKFRILKMSNSGTVITDEANTKDNALYKFKELTNKYVKFEILKNIIHVDKKEKKKKKIPGTIVSDNRGPFRKILNKVQGRSGYILSRDLREKLDEYFKENKITKRMKLEYISTLRNALTHIADNNPDIKIIAKQAQDEIWSVAKQYWNIDYPNISDVGEKICEIHDKFTLMYNQRKKSEPMAQLCAQYKIFKIAEYLGCDVSIEQFYIKNDVMKLETCWNMVFHDCVFE